MESLNAELRRSATHFHAAFRTSPAWGGSLCAVDTSVDSACDEGNAFFEFQKAGAWHEHLAERPEFVKLDSLIRRALDKFARGTGLAGSAAVLAADEVRRSIARCGSPGRNLTPEAGASQAGPGNDGPAAPSARCWREQRARGPEDPAERGRIEYWAAVHDSGMAHGRHDHPASSVSGVYYVDVPDGSGGIAWHDPRPSVDGGRVPLAIFPKSGELVLFPSWLEHEVRPSSFWTVGSHGRDARAASGAAAALGSGEFGRCKDSPGSLSEQACPVPDARADPDAAAGRTPLEDGHGPQRPRPRRVSIAFNLAGEWSTLGAALGGAVQVPPAGMTETGDREERPAQFFGGGGYAER
jgi:hypothetical protein